MAIRLDCNVSNTQELLVGILTHLNQGQRVLFLCDAGTGGNTIQRAKVMLSRKRKKLRLEGQKRRHFLMHHTIHPHTENGKRYDAVVVWKSQTQTQRMIETLEDLVGTGAEL